jgi:RimJ/RimL family protein N-acetyltransferase
MSRLSGKAETGEAWASLLLPDGSEVLLRTPRPADAAALVAFNIATAEDYGKLVPEPGEVLSDVGVQREMLEDAEEGAGSSLLLGAFVGEMVAGTVTLFSVGLVKVRHVVELGIAVHPAFRRMGIGSTLLSAALAHAESQPVLEKVVLRVFGDNEPALQLYRSAGFVEEGRQRGQYLFRDGSRHDAVWMAKFLR